MSLQLYFRILIRRLYGIWIHGTEPRYLHATGVVKQVPIREAMYAVQHRCTNAVFENHTVC